MKLTIRQIQDLKRGIELIHGLQNPTITLKVDGKNQQVKRDNVIRIGDVALYALRKNIRKIKVILEGVEESRLDLVKKYSEDGKINLNSLTVLTPNPDGGKPTESPNQAALDFQKAYEALMLRTEDVDLHVFDISELNLYHHKNNPTGNLIPGDVLEAIDDMLTESVKVEPVKPTK